MNLLPFVFSRFLASFCLWAILPGLLRADDLTPARCRLADLYSRAHGGEGLRIEQHGRTVYESYLPGLSAGTPRKIYSGTKSFIALVALAAERDGLLRLDEPAGATLPEWRGDRRGAITLEQLLSQTSGLAPGGDIIYPARDQLAAALRVPLIDPPGRRFHYGPAGYQAFGEILKRKLRARGEKLEPWLRRRIFAPLHVRIAAWAHDDAGNPLLHAGLQLSAKEWGRFGEDLLAIRRDRKSDFLSADDFGRLLEPRDANPAYGIGFWLNEPPPDDSPQPVTQLQVAIDGDQLDPGGPDDLCACLGSFKQRLYVLPSLDLVIVRWAHEAPFSDGDFLSRLLTGRPHPDTRSH